MDGSHAYHRHRSMVARPQEVIDGGNRILLALGKRGGLPDYNAEGVAGLF
jgi:hypothetical protein